MNANEISTIANSMSASAKRILGKLANEAILSTESTLIGSIAKNFAAIGLGVEVEQDGVTRVEITASGRAVLAYIQTGELPAPETKEETPTMETIKTIVVGRHIGDLPANIEVIEQRNIVWSLDKQECIEQLRAIVRDLPYKGAILFQNTPGILTSALMSEMQTAGGQLCYQAGVIISKQGERTPDEIVTLKAGLEWDSYDAYAPAAVVKAVQLAGGRAERVGDDVNIHKSYKIEFVFNHIEWF